jgi:hypothetical protein
MEKSARIYIAGHRGMVGSALLRKLEAEGFTILFFEPLKNWIFVISKMLSIFLKLRNQNMFF